MALTMAVAYTLENMPSTSTICGSMQCGSSTGIKSPEGVSLNIRSLLHSINDMSIDSIISDTVLVVINNQSMTFCHRPGTSRRGVIKNDSLDTQQADMATNVRNGINLKRSLITPFENNLFPRVRVQPRPMRVIQSVIQTKIVATPYYKLVLDCSDEGKCE